MRSALKREKKLLKVPLCLKGKVIKGFQRGSKEIGVPTANLSLEELGEAFPHDCATGIFAGWAKLAKSKEIHKMVMSVGWNPFYKNTKKTVEPHLMHKFEKDFYGEELRLVVTCFIRPEADFESLEALVEAIHADIKFTDGLLEESEHRKFKSHRFLEGDEGETAAVAASEDDE